MNTIFIQMYMNIQTLKDGARLLYIPQKIIKDYADDETNNSIDRICRILIGLDGVVEYFFDGKIKEHMKRVLTDAYISGIVWSLPETNKYKKMIENIDSPKNLLYKRYFIDKSIRKQYFHKKEVYIYGAGNYGVSSYNELINCDARVVGIADSDKKKQGMVFGSGYVIESVENMIESCRLEKKCIVIANHFHLEDMVYTVKNGGIEEIAVIC